jgi:hypothetical protein
MRKWMLGLTSLVVAAVVVVQMPAVPPGGGGSVRYSVYADVALPDGSPAVGVEVRMVVETLYYVGSEPQVYTDYDVGVTDAIGHVNLYVDVPEEYAVEMNYLKAFVSDTNYTTLEAVNDITYSYAVLYPEFTVVYDTDGDSLDDNVEAQIAEKFKPVLHKHAWDNQPNLADVETILSNQSYLTGFLQGTPVYEGDVPPLHVWDGNEVDSYGIGTAGYTVWKLDFADAVRNTGAPVGSRPLYYHVYASGGNYYLQYWYFFTYNDLTETTNNQVWHEGDWEHVALKLQKNGEVFTPVAVNFYQHEGGHTKTPSECWWSSSNTATYSGIQQGYDENHTHLHIWIARDSHASYNRYDKVYDFTLDTALGWGEDHFRDNADYDPSGNDLYFEYDYLVKLGEAYTDEDVYIHGQQYLYHQRVVKSSREWLGFYGRMGDWWKNAFAATYSPYPPPLGDSHEYYDFSEDYGVFGFGNEQSTGDSFFTNGIIQWMPDPIEGD